MIPKPKPKSENFQGVFAVFKKVSENKNKNKLFDKFRMMLLFQVFLSVVIIIIIIIVVINSNPKKSIPQ